jgi:membrane-associated phospholipid phosphatase
MHLGDIRLTLPAAAAVTAWFLACRAWRSALCWTVLYALALALVGATKIAFLGWGTAVPTLGFKAISGHATGATAVLPTLLYLLVRDQARTVRLAAAALGLGLGALVAVALVAAGEHTAAEAAAGWCTGALVSLGCVRETRALPAARPVYGVACAALAFAGAAWLIKWAPLGYWMARAALALSGNDRLHSWDSCC